MIYDSHIAYFKNLNQASFARSNSVADRLMLAKAHNLDDICGLHVAWIPSFVWVVEKSPGDHARFLAMVFPKIMRDVDSPDLFYSMAATDIPYGPWPGSELFRAALSWCASANSSVASIAKEFFRFLVEGSGPTAMVLSVPKPTRIMLDSGDSAAWEKWGRAMRIIK